MVMIRVHLAATWQDQLVYYEIYSIFSCILGLSIFYTLGLRCQPEKEQRKQSFGIVLQLQWGKCKNQDKYEGGSETRHIIILYTSSTWELLDQVIEGQIFEDHIQWLWGCCTTEQNCVLRICIFSMISSWNQVLIWRL